MIAPEDIHVYSIDEVFVDATRYLDTYGLTGPGAGHAHDPGRAEHHRHHRHGGHRAPTCTCAKVAMDIEAKHLPPDANGVRIAELDEDGLPPQTLWSHRPLTDFWRVGQGYAAEAGGSRHVHHGRRGPLLPGPPRRTTTTKTCSTSSLGSTRSCS